MSDTLTRPSAPVVEGPIPPQSLEAERSVLAAMMLDHESIGRALELIEPPAFYRVAHQKIFESVVALYNKNERADLITVAEELRMRGDLEAIGGQPALAQVLEYATTSANLEEHARIVNSKFLLRSLIKGTAEIQQECFADSDESGSILDRAEQKIFAITDRRVRQGLVSLKELLKPAFEQIQALYERKTLVTGVPSGYEDLDKMTSGFQPGDLVIIAGRPSMGKTSLAINVAENASIHHKFPVAVFSLEMSKEQLVLRMLGSQSEVPLHKIRNGYLGQEDWPRLTTGAGLLTQAPIMIDDSASLTVFEISAPQPRILWRLVGFIDMFDTRHLLQDPRLRIRIEDGRKALEARSDSYDVIETDATWPETAGSGNLYSVEFFRAAARRLRPGGLMCTWAPTPRVVATFRAVFPHVLEAEGGDVLIGSLDPISFEPLAWAARAATATPYLGAARARDVADAVAKLRPAGPLPQVLPNRDLWPRDEYAVP